MAKNPLFSSLIAILCLSIIVSTTKGIRISPSQSPPFVPPKELASKLLRDNQTLTLASNDYGQIIHNTPLAVFEPTSITDIINLVKFSSSNNFKVAARGKAHSIMGQAMSTNNGLVLNMTNLNGYRNGSGIVVSDCVKGNNNNNNNCYVDVGGEQLWIDVLHKTLERGLAPISWTDYLYLTVGGTLSNAGISGQSFQFGPQISNVLELDVVTGNGELVTCSKTNNSEAFYAVLGGLGEFGVITRARIPLVPAPSRVKWLRLIYNDFSAFSKDQEYLISLNHSTSANYVEGMLLLNQPPLDLSFYPALDQPRITSLVTQNGITYVLELAKYYDQNSQSQVQQDVDNLVKGLKFVPTFKFEKDVTYEEFLNRVHEEELVLREKGLWNVPHVWLNLFIPGSQILDFNEGVFKGIILKQNITLGGVALVYPMNRNKWDDKMSAVIPDEDVFYTLGLLHGAIGLDQQKALQAQNQQILQFCNNAGIKIKEYLTGNKTHEAWVEHFGTKWQLFQDRKTKFDPKNILSPGQGIF